MESIKDSYCKYLRYFLAKDDSTATQYDRYLALSYAVRSEMVDRWIETQKSYNNKDIRRVYFLSMEYIFGRSLRHNIQSIDIGDDVAKMAEEIGFSLTDIYEQEESFDLGNGGKARLAACMQEAMATASIPAMAYGLRYDYGLFKQEIEHGFQVEKPFDWMHKGHSWEIIRPEYCCDVSYAGSCEVGGNPENPLAGKWKEAERVIAVPYDFPVPGYRNKTVNTLRMWSARASEEFLPDYSNHGDYFRACEDKAQSGTITKLLFPDEDVLRAVELRLKQQYFLISASLHDILRRFKRNNGNLLELQDKVVIQMSGSNCALAIPELMRRLIDIENLSWKQAWEITSNVFAYTSHAVSHEAVESWPVYLLSQVLPRHMQIIYEINQKHLDAVREKFGNSNDLVREISVIEEGEVKRVKLSHLAAHGSFCINGVSETQANLLRTTVLPEFNVVTPNRFISVTNGVSQRRWLLSANSQLASLITKVIGNSWIKNPFDLANLEKHINDPALCDAFVKIRYEAKKDLSILIAKSTGVAVEPDSLFDVQCKKIHQYKRQVLNVLHILSRYLRIKNGQIPLANRVHIFAGKAAPSDQLAKQIIRLITATGALVNNDPDTNKYMKVVFLPDYGVSLAEKIIPASDLSEQIATPGQEASGTGNAKFAMNGALLIASKSGSNIEIIEKIGRENAFVFGKCATELPNSNQYQPYDIIYSNPNLKAVFALLEEFISKNQPKMQCLRPLISTLMDSDRYFVLLDFDDYLAKQNDADALFADTCSWMKRGLVNIARCGYFSADRMVRSYSHDIWKLT